MQCALAGIELRPGVNGSISALSFHLAPTLPQGDGMLNNHGVYEAAQD